MANRRHSTLDMMRNRAWRRRKRKQRPNGQTNGNGKKLVTQQSVNSAVKGICDIMRRSNCAGRVAVCPELTWILFLRILDERESREAEEAEAVGAEFRHR